MKKMFNRHSPALPFQTDFRIICGKRVLLASSFFFLTGISSGVFLEMTIGTSEKSALSEYLHEYLSASASEVSCSSLFFASLANNLLLLLIIFLAGFSVFGFPIAPAVLAYKGLALGFCTGLVAETLKNKGILLIAATLLPQHIILIPVFIMAASAASCYGLSVIKQNRLPSKKNPNLSSGSYVLLMIFFALSAGLACALEAILAPIVLSP